jgi:ubiquinone/menaquinone biosynthesis C-methylase UbiE
MDFNQYTEGYSKRVDEAVSFSGQGHEFFLEVKAKRLVGIARRHFGRTSDLAVLDVGCGVGLMERFIAPHFGRIHGVDIAAESIREAKRNAPGVQFLECDGSTLPFGDGEFDVAFAVCVLHHVPPAQWEWFVAEMFRVVKPGGLVALFEHNPLNPLTRLVVSRCEFDQDAVLLTAGTAGRLFHGAGLGSIEKRYFLFFPWRARIFGMLERAFSWLPLGAQYYILGGKGRAS